MSNDEMMLSIDSGLHIVPTTLAPRMLVAMARVGIGETIYMLGGFVLLGWRSASRRGS